MTREETRPNGAVNRHVVSRVSAFFFRVILAVLNHPHKPIPLQYLRLGAFDSPAESRKMRADDGRILESLRFHHVQLYPFTIYHASAKGSRRYTLYANSESAREKWYEKLVDAIGVNKVRGEANMVNFHQYQSGTRFLLIT
jgi:hypothetical protein